MYKLKFDGQQWEEIEALSFAEFEPSREEPMTRAQWVAIGHMMLGKAQRIENGEYGEPVDDMDDNDEWAAELREIARVIFNEFKAGDGKV